MGWLILVRHPHTRQDPALPASEWDVSERGRAEIAALAAQPFWREVAAVYTSPQRKTTLVGDAITAAYGLPYAIIPGLTEAGRDRWLAGEAFGAAQRAFFAQPDQPPTEGWESAAAAGARFVAAMTDLLARHPLTESLAVVTHATVLTLYIAHLRGESPSLDLWRGIGFAAVLKVPRATMIPAGEFVPVL